MLLVVKMDCGGEGGGLFLACEDLGWRGGVGVWDGVGVGDGRV